MVDKIDKELRRLNKKQRDIYANLISKILAGNLQGLDMIKLKGRQDIFRVRKGSYRIIFKKLDKGEITIIAFEHRSDSTYKGLS